MGERPELTLESVIPQMEEDRQTIEDLRSEVGHLQALLEWLAIMENAFQMNRDSAIQSATHNTADILD
jgi:hypothetical protein